jgi:hypothetical protein
MLALLARDKECNHEKGSIYAVLLALTSVPALAQTSGAQSGEPGTTGYERGEARSGIRSGVGAERVGIGRRSHVRYRHHSHHDDELVCLPVRAK